MHASLRISKRAEGGAAQGEKRGSAVLEWGASQPRFPWAVVFTVQSGDSHTPTGYRGQGKASEKLSEVAGFPKFICS